MDDKLRAEIKKTYTSGSWSPLQLSYKFDTSIENILIAIEAEDLLEVEIVGDQVESAGPGVPINRGTRQKVPYSKN